MMQNAFKKPLPQTYDLVIAGAGIAGLSLGLALHQALGAQLRLCLVDPQGLQRRTPGRVTAISSGTRRLFEQLGLWEELSLHAQPITQMKISDSRLADAIRPVFLTFAAPETAVEATHSTTPISYVIEDDIILKALQKACAAVDLQILSTSVEDFKADAVQNHIQLSDGGKLNAALLVGADGARSSLRGKAGITAVGWQYDQWALVINFTHEHHHEGIAEQHFLPGGPLGLLPLPGNRSSLVWMEAPKEAQHLAKLAPEVLKEALLQRIGNRFGKITIDEPPLLFPIVLSMARSFVGKRLALVSDAAHRMHPLAGQGLNYGLRDVAALAEVICDRARLGLDIGSTDGLNSYMRNRRFDTLKMLACTDALYRLFRPQAAPVRLIRDLGLGLVDRLPPLKQFFIREAAADNVESRLMRGEML